MLIAHFVSSFVIFKISSSTFFHKQQTFKTLLVKENNVVYVYFFLNTI